MSWMRAIAILCALTSGGCPVRAAVHPPLTLCPPRPVPFLDAAGRPLSESWEWLERCLNAYRKNCRALQEIRDDDVIKCEQGLR
jgi:hypothetical protein